jgi:hypothetical protein
MGASLVFGTSIDNAVEKLLNGKELDYIKTFDQEWTRSSCNYDGLMTVFDNPDIVYMNADFDEDVLLEEDKLTLGKWTKELNIDLSDNPVECYHLIKKNKKSKFKHISKEELKYFNRCSYLSLRRKGHLMLHSFNEQFVPKIEQVISVQKNSSITSYDGRDTIAGKIDLILKLTGHDKPVILDLKTSSKPYTQAQLDDSEQLKIYAAMECDNYNTDLIGYVVLCKNINKDISAICKTCNSNRNGRHKTCDTLRELLPNEDKKVNKKTGLVRCGGEWNETTVLAPKVQVLIHQVSPEKVDHQMAIESSTLDAMNAKSCIKNTKVCRAWWGSTCPFIKLCENGDPSGLRKK